MTVHNSKFFDLDAAPMSIRSVSLTVRNLDQIASFYVKLFGFNVHEQTDRTVTLGAETPFLTLTSNPDAVRADKRAPGLFHVAYLLPERQHLSSWLSHTVTEDIKIWGASDHNVSEAVYLNDPEGNGIEVYTDRPRAKWLDSKGDLYMPSFHLDLSALPDPQPWSGAPAKTRVGHVHLQTTSIPAAEAFWTGLGMDVMDRYPGGSFFGSGGYHHQIATNVWNSRGQPVQTEPKTGLSSITLNVTPEITAQTATHLAPSGVDIHLEPKRI